MVHPCTAITAAAIFFSHVVFGHMQHRLHVQISVADGLLNSSTNGRVVLLLAPAGTDPLEDTDVTSSPNFFFGRNVYHFGAGDQLSLSGGSGKHTSSGVFGWPNVSMDEVPAGDYTVQAFLNPYEAVTRSDGSVVSLPFPCGDGAPMVAGFGSLTTPATNVTVSGSPQTIALNFTAVVPVDPFRGTEIGGCSQGNYADTETLKHVKIRSSVLSEFWNRDMYVLLLLLLLLFHPILSTCSGLHVPPLSVLTFPASFLQLCRRQCQAATWLQRHRHCYPLSRHLLTRPLGRRRLGVRILPRRKLDASLGQRYHPRGKWHCRSRDAQIDPRHLPPRGPLLRRLLRRQHR